MIVSGDAVAIDTNRAIALLNGDAAARRSLDAYKELCLPVPVLGELRFGALNSSRAASNLAAIDGLAARCRVLAADAATAATYSHVRHALKSAGTPIPENDVWIGAICIQHGLALATDDRHFERVAGLTLVGR